MEIGQAVRVVAGNDYDSPWIVDDPGWDGILFAGQVGEVVQINPSGMLQVKLPDLPEGYNLANSENIWALRRSEVEPIDG